MGSVADCYDNAMCESFFATLADSAPEPPLTTELRRSQESPGLLSAQLSTETGLVSNDHRNT